MTVCYPTGELYSLVRFLRVFPWSYYFCKVRNGRLLRTHRVWPWNADYSLDSVGHGPKSYRGLDMGQFPWN